MVWPMMEWQCLDVAARDAEWQTWVVWRHAAWAQQKSLLENETTQPPLKCEQEAA